MPEFLNIQHAQKVLELANGSKVVMFEAYNPKLVQRTGPDVDIAAYLYKTGASQNIFLFAKNALGPR